MLAQLQKHAKASRHQAGVATDDGSMLGDARSVGHDRMIKVERAKEAITKDNRTASLMSDWRSSVDGRRCTNAISKE